MSLSHPVPQGLDLILHNHLASLKISSFLRRQLFTYDTSYSQRVFLVLVSGIFWLANNQMLYLSFRNYFKINNQNSGKLLIMELGHLNERTKKKLPQYKFYTKLLLDLLDYSRTKGAKIQNQISELKSTLSFDLKFFGAISINVPVAGLNL